MDDERKESPWIAWCSGIVVLRGLYVGARSGSQPACREAWREC